MILCVIAVRDEAYYLPTFLAHIAPYVDGIVALDDGSTDATPSILAAAPKMLDVIRIPPRQPYEWREDDNRRLVLERARALGARWILALDPDERLELAALLALRPLCWYLEAKGKAVAEIRFRELWDSPHQYRIDGIWGEKRQARLFRMPTQPSYTNLRRLHGPWFPAQWSEWRFHQKVPFHLYHLRMIHHADREARRDRYQRLDPEARFQPALGYGYLADTAGLTLEPIARWRRYDVRTLPPDLRPRR